MDKRTGFKMGESELTLLGREIKVGDQAPDFKAVDKELNPVSLKDFEGKVKIFSAVPSLDTQVCELQTIRFNEEVAKMGDEVRLMTISMDLPFAAQRFCSSHDIENSIMASDYQDRSFAENYGALIDELKLINRSIFVIDRDNKVQYVEYVEQNTNFPDFDKALEAAKACLK